MTTTAASAAASSTATRTAVPVGACRTALSTRLCDRPPHGRLVDRADGGRRPVDATAGRAAAAARTPTSSTTARTIAARSAGCRSIVRARPRASTSSSSIVACSRSGGLPRPFQPAPVDLDGRLRVGQEHVGVGHQHRQRHAQLVAGLLDQPPLRLGGLLEAVEHRVEARRERHHLGRAAVQPDAAAQVGGLDVLGDRPDPVDRAHRPAGPPPGQAGGGRAEREDGPGHPRGPARWSSSTTATPSTLRVVVSVSVARTTPNSSSTGT